MMRITTRTIVIHHPNFVDKRRPWWAETRHTAFVTMLIHVTFSYDIITLAFYHGAGAKGENTGQEQERNHGVWVTAL